MKQYIQSQDFHAAAMHVCHHAFFKKDHSREVNSVYFVQQVHSNRVINYSDHANSIVEADAIVTSCPDVTLSIKTADCAPVVFVDPIACIIGIAHVGWKGAKSGILANTIDAMLKLGANVTNIIAAIGPCIRQESYEVSTDFRQHFPDDALFIPAQRPGHFMFDLPHCIKKQLQSIKAVYDCQIDTYRHHKDFASYRRAQHQKQKLAVNNLTTIRLIQSLKGIDTWKKSLSDIKKNNQNKKVYSRREAISPTFISCDNHANIEQADTSTTLDLHGCTQVMAYENLKEFIRRNYEARQHNLFIITGKGAGVIQGSVYKWLEYSEISQYVLHFHYANQQDGGDGALYIKLKKA